ncbi:MAG: hypothetical protein NPIRA03_06740 [Nitrospirales bacterium]|nr:MAG: hypothetical protein NPIRA03_06740 [Nitrospirales bacterium]
MTLLTVRETAKRLGVPPRTVLRFIHEDRFNAVYRLKTAFRVPESAIQAYLDQYGRKETNPC